MWKSDRRYGRMCSGKNLIRNLRDKLSYNQKNIYFCVQNGKTTTGDIGKGVQGHRDQKRKNPFNHIFAKSCGTPGKCLCTQWIKSGKMSN